MKEVVKNTGFQGYWQGESAAIPSFWILSRKKAQKAQKENPDPDWPHKAQKAQN